VTDAAIIQRYGLSDPNPFFTELAARPYLNRVALGPHCYPPSVTGNGLIGEELWQRLTASFGRLQVRACSQAACARAWVQGALHRAQPQRERSRVGSKGFRCGQGGTSPD
jgi:hypothetical protein